MPLKVQERLEQKKVVLYTYHHESFCQGELQQVGENSRVEVHI